MGRRRCCGGPVTIQPHAECNNSQPYFAQHTYETPLCDPRNFQRSISQAVTGPQHYDYRHTVQNDQNTADTVELADDVRAKIVAGEIRATINLSDLEAQGKVSVTYHGNAASHFRTATVTSNLANTSKTAVYNTCMFEKGKFKDDANADGRTGKFLNLFATGDIEKVTIRLDSGKRQITISRDEILRLAKEARNKERADNSYLEADSPQSSNSPQLAVNKADELLDPDTYSARISPLLPIRAAGLGLVENAMGQLAKVFSSKGTVSPAVAAAVVESANRPAPTQAPVNARLAAPPVPSIPLAPTEVKPTKSSPAPKSKTPTIAEPSVTTPAPKAATSSASPRSESGGRTLNENAHYWKRFVNMRDAYKASLNNPDIPQNKLQAFRKAAEKWAVRAGESEDFARQIFNEIDEAARPRGPNTSSPPGSTVAQRTPPPSPTSSTAPQQQAPQGQSSTAPRTTNGAGSAGPVKARPAGSAVPSITLTPTEGKPTTASSVNNSNTSPKSSGTAHKTPPERGLGSTFKKAVEILSKRIEILNRAKPVGTTPPAGTAPASTATTTLSVSPNTTSTAPQGSAIPRAPQGSLTTVCQNPTIPNPATARAPLGFGFAAFGDVAAEMLKADYRNDAKHSLIPGAVSWFLPNFVVDRLSFTTAQSGTPAAVVAEGAKHIGNVAIIGSLVSRLSSIFEGGPKALGAGAVALGAYNGYRGFTDGQYIYKTDHQFHGSLLGPLAATTGGGFVIGGPLGALGGFAVGAGSEIAGLAAGNENLKKDIEHNWKKREVVDSLRLLELGFRRPDKYVVEAAGKRFEALPTEHQEVLIHGARMATLAQLTKDLTPDDLTKLGFKIAAPADSASTDRKAIGEQNWERMIQLTSEPSKLWETNYIDEVAGQDSALAQKFKDLFDNEKNRLLELHNKSFSICYHLTNGQVAAESQLLDYVRKTAEILMNEDNSGNIHKTLRARFQELDQILASEEGRSFLVNQLEAFSGKTGKYNKIFNSSTTADENQEEVVPNQDVVKIFNGLQLDNLKSRDPKKKQALKELTMLIEKTRMDERKFLALNRDFQLTHNEALDHFIYRQYSAIGYQATAIRLLEGKVGGRDIVDVVSELYREAKDGSPGLLGSFFERTIDSHFFNRLQKFSNSELQAIERTWNRLYKDDYGQSFSDMIKYELNEKDAGKITEKLKEDKKTGSVVLRPTVMAV